MRCKIASIQLKISDDLDANFKKAQELIIKATDKGADLLVLPELFPFGIVKDKAQAEIAAQFSDYVIERFDALAKKKDISIVCGLVYKDSEGRFFNSQYVISSHLVNMLRYDKIHLFTPFNENKIFEPGVAPKFFKLRVQDDVLNIGLLICFDIRFPELSRFYCYNGVDLLVVSSLWPLSRRNNFELLLRTRAMENQCFLIASNAWGRCGETEFAGASSIIGPNGKTLARAKDEDDVIVSYIDTEDILELKGFFNSSKPPGLWSFNIENKLLPLNKVHEISNSRKRLGQKLVFTNGCFDILHAGHVSYLKKARSFGDFLIVGLNSDASIRRIKGQDRPVNPEEHRALVLSALAFVDYIVIFHEDTPEKLIKTLKPHILVKGADWDEDKIVGAGFVKTYGGKVERIKFDIDTSTTKIIEKIIRR